MAMFGIVLGLTQLKTAGSSLLAIEIRGREGSGTMSTPSQAGTARVQRGQTFVC